VLVGRGPELALLEERARKAAEGEGRAVLIAGDAGIGKTRLVTELIAHWRGGVVAPAQALPSTTGRGVLPPAAQGGQVLTGVCAEGELSLPFLPFVEAIGNHLAVPDPGRGQLGSYRHELARLLPSLDAEAPPVDPSDPATGRLRLFDAILALFRQLGRRSPVLLVIEDLQWADPSTRELFDYLSRLIRPLRLLLVATCRPEDLGRNHPLRQLIRGWERSHQVEVVRLEPLDAVETRAMIRATVGADRFGPAALEAVLERSEGNPYLVEELLRAASDAGWQGGEEGLLPKTVREGVLARVEGLGRQGVEVLQAAAVLGQRFRYESLAAVTGLNAEELGDALEAAISAQLLEETDGELGLYRFRHALTRDAVQDNLIAPRRRRLHAAAAAALAAQPGTPTVEVCRHLLAARDWRSAAPLFLKAAEEAEAAYSSEDAADIYSKALEHVEGDLEQAELECRLGVARLQHGEVAEARRRLSAGIDRLEAAGAQRSAAHFRIQLAVASWQGSRLDLARAELEQARQALEPDGPSEDLAMVHVRLAGLDMVELEGEAAIASATTAVEIAGKVGAVAPRIWAYDYLGAGLAYTGRLVEGLEYLDQSFREARDGGLFLIAADALYQGALWRLIDLRPQEAMDRVHVLRTLHAGRWSRREADIAEAMTFWWGFGLPAPALDLLEQAIAPYERGADNTWIAWAEINLAAVNAELGRFAAARRLLQGQGGRSEPHLWMLNAWTVMRVGLDAGDLELALSPGPALLAGLPVASPVRRILLDIAVEVLLAAGHLAEARRVSEDALPKLGEGPLTDRVRGRLALASGDPIPAIEDLGKAAAGFASRGLAHQEARTRIVLAAALAAAGHADRGREELRTALASARERGSLQEAALARTALREAGASTEPTVELVAAALDSIRLGADPETGPLLDLECLGSAARGRGEPLRRLLGDLVRELMASPDPSHAERGAVLDAYYLRRLGSHEKVMEALFLSDATYYRRRKDGLAELTQLLQDREAAAREALLQN